MGTAFRTRGTAVAVAQNRFLLAVQELCPQVLHDLKSRVFPVYTDAAEKLTSVSGASGAFSLPALRNFQLLERDAPSVAKTLREWGDRYNLVGIEADKADDERRTAAKGDQWPEIVQLRTLWLLQATTETLFAWFRFPSSYPEPKWVNPPVAVFPEQPDLRSPSQRQRLVCFESTDWDFESGESLSAFRRRVHEALDEVLDHHIEQRRQWRAERYGLPPEVRHEDIHFDWLAQYQVSGWSAREIAAQYNTEPNKRVETVTVQKRVESLARFIRLKLRSGRPRKL